jgi:carbon-monoxide dehydrogenase medium subunit
VNIPEFELTVAEDLDHAATLVAEEAIPYCGGTELLAAMGLGLMRPERLVSIRRLPELAGVAVADGVLRIGATVTHRELTRHSAVRAAAPLLSEVADQVGNIRVRVTGTIGGNLAFGEPRSDISSTLIALNATLVVFSAAGGYRRVAAHQFIRGSFETDLGAGELLVAVEVPAGGTDVGVYRRVAFAERPVVAVAVARSAASGRWRVVVGAVGEVPFRVELAELDDADPAGIVGQIEMTADLSGSESYKQRLTEVTIIRAVEQAQRQATARSA